MWRTLSGCLYRKMGLNHQRVGGVDLETGKRIGEKKEGKRGQEGFYRNIIAHLSFRSSSLSSESITLEQDPCNLRCLLIIPFQLLQENPLQSSAFCGAEFSEPIAKPSGASAQPLTSKMDP